MPFTLQLVAEHPDHGGHQRQRNGNADIAIHDRLAFRHAIGVQFSAR